MFFHLAVCGKHLVTFHPLTFTIEKWQILNAAPNMHPKGSCRKDDTLQYCVFKEPVPAKLQK